MCAHAHIRSPQGLKTKVKNQKWQQFWEYLLLLEYKSYTRDRRHNLGPAKLRHSNWEAQHKVWTSTGLRLSEKVDQEKKVFLSTKKWSKLSFSVWVMKEKNIYLLTIYSYSLFLIQISGSNLCYICGPGNSKLKINLKWTWHAGAPDKASATLIQALLDSRR